MHKVNILILAPNSFILSLNELKSHLNFNFTTNIEKTLDLSKLNYDGFICHEEYLSNKFVNIILSNKKCFNILIASKDNNNKNKFNNFLALPTTIKELNQIIESSAVKRIFSENSSIKIKAYILDKNEKKLFRNSDFIILTEKEIKLLELFLKNQKAISKKDILSIVWRYSTDADTHTVETHIYRLRKKISEKFFDDNFILNDRIGYYL